MEMEPEKRKIISRLKRIEGQVRGLQRLIENEAPCADILTQVSAAISAMKKTGVAIITTHMEKCIRDAVGKKSQNLDEFRVALTRFIDLS
ncbi:MAG TPA: metal-sensitive transcriptional regulator [Syntrophales bacterium]|nr:metal-sensitive transcriptional regulator [Syntrophales bacterium]